jgi:uncharacterized protein YggE
MERCALLVFRKTDNKRTSLSLLGIFVFASCQSSIEQKTINVTGRAKMKVVPDMVELSLRAYSVKPAMKNAVV